MYLVAVGSTGNHNQCNRGTGSGAPRTLLLTLDAKLEKSTIVQNNPWLRYFLG